MDDEDAIRADERARCVAIAFAMADEWETVPGNAAKQRALGAAGVGKRICAIADGSFNPEIEARVRAYWAAN